MKNFLFYGLLLAFVSLSLTSCGRVPPNNYGVLMENFGKNGKSDYSEQKGRVNAWGPGTELFVVPAWEQRASFEEQTLHLKAADNTAFDAKPVYSYKVIESRVVDVVFQNSRLGSGDKFMSALENNVLEPRIYDIVKEESKRYVTDTLMATGGALRFEEVLQKKIKSAFAEVGLELLTFSPNLDFSDKVKAKIDSRNEVNTNVSVLDQQIIEQRKINELAELQTQENLIKSKGLTPEILTQQFIWKWDGKTPLYGNTPVNLLKNIQ